MTTSTNKKSKFSNKLPAEARSLVKQWIVMGLTNSEIRMGLAQRNYPSDLTDQSFTEYRQDKQVQTDIDAAMRLVRAEGMANRIRRVRNLHARMIQINHRINGATPRKDVPEIADLDVEEKEVETGDFRALVETELKCYAEMSRLVDEPIRATATITQKDAQGNITATTTLEADTQNAALQRIATIAQSNDALEDVLRLLEGDTEAASAPLATLEAEGAS